MTYPINRTPAHLRCGKMNCPSVHEIEGDKLLIVGKSVYACDYEVLSGKVAQDEDAIVIDRSLLGDLIQAPAETGLFQAQQKPGKPQCDHLGTEREENLELALHRIDQWSQAYPLDIFPEPDFARAHEVLKAHGMGIDAISASAMRRVVEGVGKIARDALSQGDRAALALDGRLLETNPPSGDHLGSEFEAKAREILDWSLSSGSEMELSALASAIASALAEAYGEGLVQAQQKRVQPQCDHPSAEFETKAREAVRRRAYHPAFDQGDYDPIIFEVATALAEAVAAERERRAKADDEEFREFAASVRSRGDVK